jgi:hypothetical protein
MQLNICQQFAFALPKNYTIDNSNKKQTIVATKCPFSISQTRNVQNVHIALICIDVKQKNMTSKRTSSPNFFPAATNPNLHD